jgi:O-acetyl-ADP-ribose deacetylase (regulator of RNase III)
MARESAYAQLIQDVTLVELPHVSAGVFAMTTEQIADIMLEVFGVAYR